MCSCQGTRRGCQHNASASCRLPRVTPAWPGGPPDAIRDGAAEPARGAPSRAALGSSRARVTGGEPARAGPRGVPPRKRVRRTSPAVSSQSHRRRPRERPPVPACPLTGHCPALRPRHGRRVHLHTVLHQAQQLNTRPFEGDLMRGTPPQEQRRARLQGAQEPGRGLAGSLSSFQMAGLL